MASPTGAMSPPMQPPPPPPPSTGTGATGEAAAMRVDGNGTMAQHVQTDESMDNISLSVAAPASLMGDGGATMAPPPLPASSAAAAAAAAAAARSSGRTIKPTLKLRGDDDDGTLDGFRQTGALDASSSSTVRQRRQTTTTNGSNASSSGSVLGRAKAPRLKLNVRGGITHRGKDPNALSGKKNAAYMDGYDRELDSSDDETGQGIAFEEQLILRMPEDSDATRLLQDWVRKREVGSEGREVEMKFKDSRRAMFKMGDRIFSSKLVDLPSIIESHKTLDNRQVFKIADISQMLLVTHEVDDEAEVTRTERGKAGFGSSAGKDDVAMGDMEDFIYEHGITPPMRYARKRRFRKRAHKRTIETVEKEVERLLAEDSRADEVENVMVDLAEAELDDSDAGGASPSASHDEGGAMSVADTPRGDGEDSMSMMGEGEGYDDDGYSQMGDGAGGMADDDVDLDLQRELEAEFARQNGRGGEEEEEEEEDEDDEDDDEDDSSEEGGTASQGRSASRASDDDFEDDLFDADAEDGEEGAQRDDGEAGEGNEDEDEEDEDEDEEEREQRVREQQLEAECKEIEGMVRKKQAEVDGAINLIMKQRNGQSLRRLQTELDMKRGQLTTLKQQRREEKEAKRIEAQAAREAEEAAAAAAAAAEGGDAAENADGDVVAGGEPPKRPSLTGLEGGPAAVSSDRAHSSSSSSKAAAASSHTFGHKAANGEPSQLSATQSTLQSSHPTSLTMQDTDADDDADADAVDGEGEDEDDGDEDEDEEDDDPLFGGA